MATDTTLSLPLRALHELPDAAGVEIRCLRGCLWLTLDHDTRDIVLAEGESFLTTEHRRGLIYALEPSTVALEAAVAATQPMRGNLRTVPA